MCGIVGYIGSQKAQDFIMQGLEKLEYRGYDSAGIAILNDGKINIEKKEGRLSNLGDVLAKSPIDGSIGIGHTRWATHGKPSDVNSHPHFNKEKTIALVHNGIIENYSEIKEELLEKGYVFNSETDTEVVVQLVDFYFNGDLLDAVRKTVSRLRGAYALGVVAVNDPERIIAVREESPLIVGIGKNENYIASDIPALLEYTKDVYLIENGEIVDVTKDSITIYDKQNNVVNREIYKVEWTVEAATKGGYDHFMIKEILEQPKALRDTLETRIDKDGNLNLENINLSLEELNKFNKIYIVACGTAYNAGLVGKYIIEKLVRIGVSVEIASEFRYGNAVVDENTLFIAVSQSGETLDTLVSLKESRKKGAKIFALTNVVGSSIAREADEVFYTWAGPEIAVASTKAYTTQAMAFYMIALDWGLKKGTITKEFYSEVISNLRKLPENVQKVLDQSENIKGMVQKIKDSEHAFYLGRGLDYAISIEGALKSKEISYIHSEAFASGELKHGTMALIEEGTPIILSASQDELVEKSLSNLKEVKARGAYTIAIVKEGEEHFDKESNEVIYVPRVDDMYSGLLAVVVLQMIAYYLATARGCDVDKPRNLAKSVTVE